MVDKYLLNWKKISPNFGLEFEKIYLIMGTEMIKCQI